MSEIQQAKFDGWAIVEVMGHQTFVGYVTTEAYGQAVLFRIDVPQLDERERVTKAPGYVDDRYVPAGTTVKEGAVQGFTKLVGSGSIYCITPCSKDAALAALERSQRRPLMHVALPEAAQLAPGELAPEAEQACPTCHSTANPCECDSADDQDPDFDDEEATGDEQRAFDDIDPQGTRLP
jgi:hypothetical protein